LDHERREGAGPDHPTVGIIACAASALLVLVPYATVGLPFRAALHVQAVAILAIVTAAATAGLALLGLPRLTRVPAGLRAGLALYALAAGLGTTVGLARGNPLDLVAGQVLSMGLLPLGAVAGLALDPRRTWRAFAVGVVAAAAVASSVHLVGWVLQAAHGRPVLRLFLGNSVTLGGLSLLAALLCLAGTRAQRPPTRAAAWACLGLMALYLLGSGIRGLWIVVLPSAGVFLLLAGTRSLRLRTATVAVAGSVLLGSAAVGFHLWLVRERANLIAAAPSAGAMASGGDGTHAAAATAQAHVLMGEGDRPAELLAGPVAVPGAGTYRLRVLVGGGETGEALVAARWRDGAGQRLGALLIRSRPFGRPRWLETVGAAPEGAEKAEVVVSTRGGASGSWTLASPRLELLGRNLPTALVAQGAYLDRRLSSLLSFAADPQSPPDVSVALRQGETRAALSRFASAGWTEKLLGHGLGATFRPGDAARPEAAAPAAGEQNYLHNFYAFLAFKLGLLGTILVGSALTLWLLGLAAWARRAPSGLARGFLAAAASAWAGYLALAVSSPEILNFRVAPLLGLLLAASIGARAVGRPSPAEGSAGQRRPADHR